MRSRYSAYATGNVGYVLATTHPGGPSWRDDINLWRQDLNRYTRGTDFRGLKIVASGMDAAGKTAWVSFEADLHQAGQSVPMHERSEFRVHDTVWKYYGGRDEDG